MKYHMCKIITVLSFAFFIQVLFLYPSSAGAAPRDQLPADTRCPVCGMFVAKFDVWITQILYDDGAIHSFDGVKDMMAFYLDPAAYRGPEQQRISEIWVKDYYSLKWVDGRQAFYVVGSDVHGPMGHELVPFATRGAAEAFLADHHGSQILAFAEISPGLIARLRVGSKMKNNDK